MVAVNCDILPRKRKGWIEGLSEWLGVGFVLVEHFLKPNWRRDARSSDRKRKIGIYVCTYSDSFKELQTAKWSRLFRRSNYSGLSDLRAMYLHPICLSSTIVCPGYQKATKVTLTRIWTRQHRCSQFGFGNRNLNNFFHSQYNAVSNIVSYSL